MSDTIAITVEFTNSMSDRSVTVRVEDQGMTLDEVWWAVKRELLDATAKAVVIEQGASA